MDDDEREVDAGWAEVVYLLVARYGMPDAATVADDFARHLRDNGCEVPAIASIRDNVDTDQTDLAGLTGGQLSDAAIRQYFRDVLQHYDALMA